MSEQKQKECIRNLIYMTQQIDRQITDNGKHSNQVSFWAKRIARKLNLNLIETQNVYWAAMLHDIGKLSLPSAVLCKISPLSEDEWRLMRLHPTIGANIVESVTNLVHIAPIIQSHHEKLDGSGYPQGLYGDLIPLGARILTVVDSYDAMTNNRVYRKAIGHSNAVIELRRCQGYHFDPVVVQAFLHVLATAGTTKHEQADR